MSIVIRPMSQADIAGAARVHADAFPRQERSREWISANFGAYPRIQYFVAESEERIVGFIEWIEKAGLRADAVLELEQIAVTTARRGEGIGKLLIRRSLPVLSHRLADRGARLKSILVSTRVDNEAQRLYASELGARPVAVIRGLYSADEVLMLAPGPFGER